MSLTDMRVFQAKKNINELLNDNKIDNTELVNELTGSKTLVDFFSLLSGQHLEHKNIKIKFELEYTHLMRDNKLKSSYSAKDLELIDKCRDAIGYYDPETVSKYLRK